MGRPRKKIDLVELEKLYGLQCTDKEVAAFLRISAETLERRKKTQKVANIVEVLALRQAERRAAAIAADDPIMGRLQAAELERLRATLAILIPGFLDER